MVLLKEQIKDIEEVLRASLRNKFQNYKPEPASMPFHTRLLGKDRLALYSFIHSLNTNFGTSIFEPVGLALAQKNFKIVTAQAIAGDHISNKAQNAIQKEAPGLRYGIATFPYLSGNEEKINYARTMNLVVFNRSSHSKEAWQFLKYLSQSNNSQYYFLQTKNPPARLDLISLAINDSQAGVFASQILTSRDWYQIDSQEISTIFNDMIESVVLQNILPVQAIFKAASGIELLWQQKLKNQ